MASTVALRTPCSRTSPRAASRISSARCWAWRTIGVAPIRAFALITRTFALECQACGYRFSAPDPLEGVAATPVQKYTRYDRTLNARDGNNEKAFRVFAPRGQFFVRRFPVNADCTIPPPCGFVDRTGLRARCSGFTTACGVWAVHLGAGRLSVWTASP